MPKPLIFAVDDDRAVLHTVERDLRQKYGRDYRVIKADSGASALEALLQLVERNERVALFVVDQRMPQINGVEFLERAMVICPDARKVLLTAYADTEAAINAINRVGLDYYLMKPWDPPQEHLYPVLDGLLEDWKANTRAPFEGIRVLGTLWSSASHDIKDFLARNAVPYQFLDIEREPEAQKLLSSVTPDASRIPVLMFPDGSTQIQPTQTDLAEKVGLGVRPARPFYDVVIIGGGPAGLSAAVYASADGLKVLLVERHAPGGQAGNSPKIENYLGFPAGISGGDLTRRAVTQARRFGTEVLTTRSVAGIRADGNTRIVKLDDDSEIACKIILIASGKWFRMLELPGIEKWNGAGVYYGAAHTEAMYYKDKDVIVLGAANSAAQGMLFLARYARSVTVLVRSEPDWSNYLDAAIRSNERIHLVDRSVIREINGDETIQAVVIEHTQTGALETLPAAAVFVFIGQKAQTDFAADLLRRTEDGSIMTGLSLLENGIRPAGWLLNRDPLPLETNVPGIFAAGDVRNGTRHGVAAAVGDGDAAVSMFWQYLSTI